MYLVQTVGPSTYPVTLVELKAAARVDASNEDDFLTGLIAAASRAVGEMAGRVLTAETWALSFQANTVGDLPLPKSPVQSITSITYYDADDASQSATVSDFYLMKGDDRAVLRPKSGVSWPSANTARDDAITVTFVAGYTACPKTLKHAVLLLGVHLFEHRQAATADALKDIPFGVESLVSLERLGWVA